MPRPVAERTVSKQYENEKRDLPLAECDRKGANEE